VLDDGYADGAVTDLNGHTPSGPLRGGKYEVYEGGTRVPFIVRWPGRVSPGVSDALVSLMDFSASFAVLTGQKIPAGGAPDSINVLPALLGDTKLGREKLVEHDGARVLGFRDGVWKFIEPTKRARVEYSPSGELYDLGHDLGETNNLREAQPEKAKALSHELLDEESAGRAADTKQGTKATTRVQ
jgi:arylsulfatase A-like enzyme